MRNCKFILGMLALSVGTASGCGAARPTKYYQLTVPSDVVSENDPNAYPVTLLVGSFTASHLYREDHIVYGSSSEDMGTYEYHRWAQPPTEMIGEILLRELRVSGRYRSVESLRSNAHGDFVLHGELYDFMEISGSPLKARLAMELEMRDTKSGSTVWTHSYSYDEPVSGKEVGAVVAALDHNVQRATAEIRTSLEQYFAAHPPAAAAQ